MEFIWCGAQHRSCSAAKVSNLTFFFFAFTRITITIAFGFTSRGDVPNRDQHFSVFLHLTMITDYFN